MSGGHVPFSMRMGVRQLAQLAPRDMPEALRLSLWNVIQPWIWQTRYGDEYQRRAEWVYNFHAIRWPTDEIPPEGIYSNATIRLKEWMLADAEWHQLYDFVEALPELVWYGVHAKSDDPRELKLRSMDAYQHVMHITSSYIEQLNVMLAREGAPYRYVAGSLVPVSNEHELDELTRALGQTPFRGARMHIERAASALSQRPEPDYRNSIKESVSAIESLLQEATGLKGERLPRLLDAFEKKYGTDLHGALKSALASLYGWTCDDGGIRHGIFGGETVGRAEAQFMLVACSALVNFLVSKSTGK